MGSLNDRKFSSLVENHKTAAENSINTVYAQIGAGQYNAALPTLTDGDFGHFQMTNDGKLYVQNSSDIELGAVEIKDGDSDTRMDVITQDAAFGTATNGLAVFGKYQVVPTTYTDGDAAPVLLDANGRIVLSSDIEIGAVELKNGATDDRVEIVAPNTKDYDFGMHTTPARYMATPPTLTDTFSSPLLLDVTGKVLTASGNVEYVDDSAGSTVTTSKGNAMMAIATSDVVDANDVGALRMSVNRNLGVDISEQSLTALKISKDANANLVTNPIFASISDGTTMAEVLSSTHDALKIALTDGTNIAAVGTGTTKCALTSLHDGTTLVTFGTGTVKTVPSAINDGTTTVVVETDGTKKALNVNITDGTNDMPTMDDRTRAGFVKITDGSTEAMILNGTFDAVYTAITDGANVVTPVVQDSAFGTTTVGFPVFGKYQTVPTIYSDNDAAPLLLDANGRLVLFDAVARKGFVALTDGTNTVSVGVDDSALAATPSCVPVCGEYRTVDTNYTDGDATVLQTTIAGHLKTRCDGYDTSTDSVKHFEVSPLDQHYVEESLVDTTNLAAAANYYPASTGALVGAYKDFSFTGKIIEDGADTITLLVQGMNDEDTAAGDWITIYGYRDDANTTAASVAVTASTQTFSWSFNNFNFKYYRIVVTPTSATNTAIVKLRKKAL